MKIYVSFLGSVAIKWLTNRLSRNADMDHEKNDLAYHSNDPDYQEKRANLRDKMIRLHRRNGLKVLRLRRGDKDLNEEEIKGKRQS